MPVVVQFFPWIIPFLALGRRGVGGGPFLFQYQRRAPLVEEVLRVTFFFPEEASLVIPPGYTPAASIAGTDPEECKNFSSAIPR